PWSLYLSNLNSLPMDRYNVFKPIPNYVVFQPPKLFNTTENNAAKILSNPKNSEIPSNWEVLYKSNKTGVIVYKINNELISKLPNR
ncbi:MAG: hypothetical protein KGI33_12890, partial [Thaumarchaeota archaeon]|nr:hypothetical protein [Nitrososphaerota archaeon]